MRSGARTRLLSSRLDALMMAFFPLLLPPRLHALMMAFFPLLPSTPFHLFPQALGLFSPYGLGLPQKASSTPVPCSSSSTLGAHPLPFSPLHIFLHLLLISLLSSRLFLFLLPSSPPCPRFSRPFSLFFFTIVDSCAFYYRESRYTRTHYSCDLESLRVCFLCGI